MKHLKIRVKLLLGFALVSILAITVGIVGAVGLTSTNSKYSEMLSLSGTGISSMADIREYYQLQRVTLRGIVVDFNDPAKMQTDMDNLKSYEAGMADAMAVYESTIIDPSSEKNYFDAKDAYLNVYGPAKQQLLEAAKRGDYDATVAAVSVCANAAVPITEGLRGTIDYMNELMAVDSADLAGHAAQMIGILIVVMVLATVCAMALGIYLSALISKPIKTMSDFFVRFGTTGDLALSEEDQKNIAKQSVSRDEIGRCISAAGNMVSRLIEINGILGKVADGDLSVDIQALSDRDSIGMSVEKVINNLNAILGKLRSASSQVSTGSEQISQGAQELASGSSQQAASIEEFSKTLTALQEKTQLNAGNSLTAVKVNEDMSAMIEESVSSMGQMLEAMKGIDESSKNITRVIKAIDDIAFQTNILALNAAVEAARAGLHGKGFAVVADEVRNLASKSAAAAKETAALIEGSTERVNEGNQIVAKTNSSLEAVASGSREVVRLIGEVSSSTNEQAKAIADMNHSIEQISNVVQENSASAEESAAASEEMSSQAATLKDIMSGFKIKTGIDASGVNGGYTLSSVRESALSLNAGAGNKNEKYQ